MASVVPLLARIKRDLQQYLPVALIEEVCRQSGHRWRRRRWHPVATLEFFVLQILHGNTAMTHLRLLAGMPLNAAAYCKARMRLPLEALAQLLRRSSTAMSQALTDQAWPDRTHWCGHRTLLVDGTGTIAPDTPALQKVFPQPRSQRRGCGLPAIKVLGLFDAITGLVVDMLCFSLLVNEHARVWKLHRLLAAGDLLVGDCGFCSFAHLALLSERGVLALFRMSRSYIVSFRPGRKHYERRRGTKQRRRQKGRPRSKFVRKLGAQDQLVRWTKQKPKDGPRWMSRGQFMALPQELLVRELRYQIVERGRRTRVVTVVTTLLDEKKYSKQEVAKLYGLRWRIETHWRELKTLLGMERLKCRTEAGVRKELLIYGLVYNLMHAAMMKAAIAQRVSVDRISFLDMLRCMISVCEREETQLVVNPARPGRWEPRLLKGPLGSFKKMKFPRATLRSRFERGLK